MASRCSNFIHFKSGYLCISSEFHFTRFQWGNQWSKTLTVTLQNFLRSMVADFTDVVQTSPTTGVLSRRAEGVRVDQHQAVYFTTLPWAKSLQPGVIVPTSLTTGVLSRRARGARAVYFTRLPWGNQWARSPSTALQNSLRSMVAGFKGFWAALGDGRAVRTSSGSPGCVFRRAPTGKLVWK